MNVRVAILDTETTGLSSRYDRMIEVAILLIEADPMGRMVQILDRYHELDDPGFPIPWQATAVHGITGEMVKGHRIDPRRVQGLLSQADLIVAHNSGFDKGFVAQVVEDVQTMNWACSCRGIPWKQFWPGLPNTKLQDLARCLKVNPGTAHRAMGDVETLLDLLLLNAQPKGGGETLLGHLIAKKVKRSKGSLNVGLPIVHA